MIHTERKCINEILLVRHLRGKCQIKKISVYLEKQSKTKQKNNPSDSAYWHQIKTLVGKSIVSVCVMLTYTKTHLRTERFSFNWTSLLERFIIICKRALAKLAEKKKYDVIIVPLCAIFLLAYFFFMYNFYWTILNKLAQWMVSWIAGDRNVYSVDDEMNMR